MKMPNLMNMQTYGQIPELMHLDTYRNVKAGDKIITGDTYSYTNTLPGKDCLQFKNPPDTFQDKKVWNTII